MASNEQLLDKYDDISTNQNIRNINYNMIFLVILACGYSVLFIIMSININSMTNNLNQIIHVMNTIQQSQINTTSIKSIHNDMTILKDCALHKYCKRISE